MARSSKKIKLYFTTIVLSILVLMVAGAFLFSSNYLSTDMILGTWKYVKTKYYLCCADGSLNLSLSETFNSTKEASKVSSGSASSIPVLVYHGIVPEQDGSNITEQKFIEHMIALKRAGYTTITTKQMYDFMRGEVELPEYSILITFDDGRSDSVYNSQPIFKALGYNAAMFAVSQHSVDRVIDTRHKPSHYLSRVQLQRLSEGGQWEIQAHTHNGHDPAKINAEDDLGHYYSNRLWLESEERLETNEEYAQRIRADLAAVQSKLEDTVGQEVNAIAFPFGDFGQGTKNMPSAEKVILDNFSELYDIGFYQYYPGHRFTQNYNWERLQQKDNFLIRRINTDIEWSGNDLVSVLENSKAKSLPYTSSLKDTAPWLVVWSSHKLHAKGLELKPVPGETGAAVVLDGSGSWKDYEVKAKVNTSEEHNTSIWVRYRNDDNHSVCNFNREFIHIEQTREGEMNTIRGVVKNYGYNGGTMDLGVRVKDNIIECLFNGQVIVRSEFLDPELSQGGIGFKTWNRIPDSAGLILEHLEVFNL